jgi:hypothetical protein
MYGSQRLGGLRDEGAMAATRVAGSRSIEEKYVTLLRLPQRQGDNFVKNLEPWPLPTSRRRHEALQTIADCSLQTTDARRNAVLHRQS